VPHTSACRVCERSKCPVARSGAGLRARVQAIVYKNVPNNIADLRQRIIREFREIRTDSNFCHRVRNSFDKRIRACIRAEGGHFEHLI